MVIGDEGGKEKMERAETTKKMFYTRADVLLPLLCPPFAPSKRCSSLHVMKHAHRATCLVEHLMMPSLGLGSSLGWLHFTLGPARCRSSRSWSFHTRAPSCHGDYRSLGSRQAMSCCELFQPRFLFPVAVLRRDALTLASVK